MDRENAERIVAATFGLRMELSRGQQSVEREQQELIKFAKEFNKNVDVLVGVNE